MKNYFRNISLIPENEEARLSALRRYEILDTPPESAFNNIVKIAVRVFNVPIALVSLVDKERVFFKANIGMDGVTNVERGKSLCSLAILTEKVTVFENAIKEPCLLSNPLVAGDFGLRFYAAAPLKTRDGFNIGSVCIVDFEPRTFTEDEIATLEDLASIVMDEIELRIASIKAIREKQEHLDASISKNEELIKKNNDLDNFIYTASHDLKAPVSNIEGLMHALNNILAEEKPDREDVEQVMSMMHKSVEKFQVTIKDLTEISKTQKSLHDDIMEIDIAETIEDIEILLQDQIYHSDTVIIKDLSCSPTVSFSKVNFKTLLLNLVSNAIKYRADSRKPVIMIRTENQGTDFVLTVSDNGIGIPGENLPKIFEMFKRAHNHVEGSGVGLYLVKRIIDNAGGKIKTESIVDCGSKFTISIPTVNKNNLSVIEKLQHAQGADIGLFP